MMSCPAPVLVSEEAPPALLAMTSLIRMLLVALVVLTTSSLFAPMVSVSPALPMIQYLPTAPAPTFMRPLTENGLAPLDVVTLAPECAPVKRIVLAEKLLVGMVPVAVARS